MIGEGAKPIFQREEFSRGDNTSVFSSKPDEERRVTLVNRDKSIEKSRSHRRHSRSLSPPRRSSRSPHRSSRRESISRHRDRYDRRYHDNYERERSVQYRDRNHHSSRRSSKDRYYDERSRRSHSVSREHHRPSRNLRNCDDRNLREPRLPMPPAYIDPMAMSFYYENFARPFLIDPIMAIRGPMTMGRGRGRGRMPPMMMNPIQPPFPPRFFPPDQFRPNLPPNQRFGRTF